MSSYVLPPNTLTANNKLKINAFGYFAGNSNGKTVKIYFGSTPVGTISGSINGPMWELEAEILLTSTSLQKSASKMSYGNSLVIANYACVENATQPITIKCAGKNDVTSVNDIVLIGMSIELV